MPDYNLGRAHGTIKIDYEKSGAEDARDDIRDVGDEATKSEKKISESTKQSSRDLDVLGGKATHTSGKIKGVTEASQRAAAANAELAASAKKAAESLNFDHTSTDEQAASIKKLEADVKSASAAAFSAREKLTAAEENLANTRKNSASTAKDIASAEATVRRAQQNTITAVQRLETNTKALSAARERLKNTTLPDLTPEVDNNTLGQFVNHLRAIQSNTAKTSSVLNTFSGRLKLIVGGVAVLTPGIAGLAVSLASLAGLAGVAAGALASLGAVGGTVATGIMGVGDAFKAAAAETKAAGGSAGASAKQHRAAARAIEDAQRQVADAQENLRRTYEDTSRAMAQALKGVVQAQRDLQDAQREALRAQEALNRARQQATRDLEDMQFALTGGSIDERQAILDVKKAQEELNKVQADPTATADDIEQATLNLEKQQLALEQTRKENERLKADATAAAEAGVEGSDAVVNAQDNVRSSTQAVADAQDALAEAQDNVRQTQVDSQRQIADAVQAVIDAQRNLADAYADAADAGGGAAAKLNDALANLSPNARAFVKEVLGLRSAWDALRKSVQDKLFAGLAGEVQPLAREWFPLLESGMGKVATALNGIIQETVAYLHTAEAQRNVANIFDNTGQALTNLRGIVRDLLAAFLDIASVGSDFLPGLADGAANAAAKFREFINAAQESGKLRQWMQDAMDTAQTLWQLIKNLGDIIGTVFSAINQQGGGALNTLTKITGQVADFLHSAEGQEALKSLGKILASIGGAVGKVFLTFLQTAADLLVALEPFIVAFADSVGTYLAGALQVVAPIFQVFADIIGFLGPALGPVIAAIYAANKAVDAAKIVWQGLNVVMKANPFLQIATIIITLALLIIQNWDSISQFLSDTWNGIKELAATVWNAITSFFVDKWNEIKQSALDIWTSVHDFLQGIWEGIRSGVVNAWNAIGNFFSQKLQDIVGFFRDRINDIVQFFRELPGNVWNFIKSLPERFVNLGKDIVSGILRGLGNLASALWNKLKSAVSAAWDSVLDFFGISSPSKLAAEAGEFIVLGLVQGIDRSADEAVRAASDMAAAVGNELTGASGTLATTVDMTAGNVPAALGAATLRTATTPVRGTDGASASGGGRTVIIENVTVQVQGNLDPTNPVAFRQTMVRLKDGLRNLDKEYA